MKTCMACGAVLPDEAVFCTNCGTPVEEDDFEATDVLEENKEKDSNDIKPKDSTKESGMPDSTDVVPEKKEKPAVSFQQPTFIGCYKNFWRNCINFSGRARRSEYWYVVLANMIIVFAAMFLDAIIVFFGAFLEKLPIPFIGKIIGGLYMLYLFATIVPSLSLVVRRLHDIGKAWYYIFFALIPFAGIVILLVWLFRDSEPGSNAFGDNPKGISA